jgi:hypothetical protein
VPLRSSGSLGSPECCLPAPAAAHAVDQAPLARRLRATLALRAKPAGVRCAPCEPAGTRLAPPSVGRLGFGSRDLRGGRGLLRRASRRPVECVEQHADAEHQAGRDGEREQTHPE